MPRLHVKTRSLDAWIELWHETSPTIVRIEKMVGGSVVVKMVSIRGEMEMILRPEEATDLLRALKEVMKSNDSTDKDA